jgi:hypothetical protein
MELYEKQSISEHGCSVSNVRAVYALAPDQWTCTVDLTMDNSETETVTYTAHANDTTLTGQWVVARIINDKAGAIETADAYAAFQDATEIARQARSLSAEKLAEIASALRWQQEVGGITVEGIKIATDDRAKTLLGGLYRRAEKNPDGLHRWKGPDGELKLTSAQVITLNDALNAHIQACFDTELDALALINTGSITTEAALRAVFA